MPRPEEATTEVQADEIGEMLDEYLDTSPEDEPSTDEPPVEEPPSDDPPPEEEPPTGDDPPAEDPPVEDPPLEELPVEEPSVDDPPTDPPVEDPPPEEPSLEDINAGLVARVEALSQQLISGAPVVPVPTPDGVTPDTPSVPVPATPAQPDVVVPTPVEPINYMEGINVGDLADNPELLNAIFNKAVGDAEVRAVGKATEQILRAVPDLMVGYMARHTAQTNLARDFYDEHPDLKRVKSTVAAVASDLHAKNTDWSMEKIFNEAATGTRKLLGLKKGAETKTKPEKRKPAFVKNVKSSRVDEPKLTGLQEELADITIGL